MIELNIEKVFPLGEALKKAWEFINKFPKQTLLPLVFFAVFDFFLYLLKFFINLPYSVPAKIAELIPANFKESIGKPLPIVIVIIIVVGLLLLLILLLVYGYVEYYCRRIGLKWFSNQEEPQIPRDLKIDYRLFGRYLLLSFVVALIVIGGIFLLIVPGIIWQIMYFFTTYCFIYRNTSIKESLRMSSKMTHGVKWQLFGTSLIVGIINSALNNSDNMSTNIILSLIASFIGIFMHYVYAYLFIDFYRQTFRDTEDEFSDHLNSTPDGNQGVPKQTVTESSLIPE